MNENTAMTAQNTEASTEKEISVVSGDVHEINLKDEQDADQMPQDLQKEGQESEVSEDEHQESEEVHSHYTLLSHILQDYDIPEKKQPQFMKNIKRAVLDEILKGSYLDTRFTISRLTRQGEQTSHSTRDMIFLNDAALREWVNVQKDALQRSNRASAKTKISFEAIDSGEIDFDALVAKTRSKLSGQSRKKITVDDDEAPSVSHETSADEGRDEQDHQETPSAVSPQEEVSGEAQHEDTVTENTETENTETETTVTAPASTTPAKTKTTASAPKSNKSSSRKAAPAKKNSKKK